VYFRSCTVAPKGQSQRAKLIMGVIRRYDVSGVSADRVEQVIKDDWMHLVRHRRILDSPNYLREKGKPVLALWGRILDIRAKHSVNEYSCMIGFGFSDRGYTVHQVRGIIAFIRDNTPGGIYLIGGVPAHWRTSVSDAVPDPEFVQVRQLSLLERT
jgi:hypothetical protein